MVKSLQARILGTGMSVPAELLSNDYFAAYLDTTDEWITSRSGIRQRYRAGDGESTVTMARNASLAAMEDAGVTIDDIDMILFATATPDTLVPSSACWLHGELGAKNIPAMDINAACAGLIYGMVHASGLIAAGIHRNILVVGAEALTRIVDFEDRSTCVLFGDAASAFVMTASQDDRGLLYFELGADGTRADHIWVPAGGARLPASEMTVAERLHSIKMKGREVYKFAVVKFHRLVKESLAKLDLTLDDIDYIVPHQSNLRIIESVQEKLKLPREKFVINIDRYGNTSAASVGLALHEARMDGRIKPGNLVLMVAFGAGLTWAIAICRM